jgi:hypothetical protein
MQTKKTLKRFVLATIVFLLAASPALALDLLPPAIYVDPPDPLPAGAQKASLFQSEAATCEEGALTTTPPSYGFVVLNTSGGRYPLEGTQMTLVGEISIKGAEANMTYDIYVNQHPGGCPTTPMGMIMTNGQGNGNGHIDMIRVATATTFWVSAQARDYPLGAQDILRSTAVFLD